VHFYENRKGYYASCSGHIKILVKAVLHYIYFQDYANSDLTKEMTEYKRRCVVEGQDDSRRNDGVITFSKIKEEVRSVDGHCRRTSRISLV
jgi:hypothetical protein